MVIRVLGILCVGPAHQSNKSTQMEIANAEALITLVQLLRNSNVSLVQVNYRIVLFRLIITQLSFIDLKEQWTVLKALCV